MNGFLRVIPYVWPYRRKVAVSFIFAVLVAILWGANLSAIGPVVKVLLQKKNLTQYVDEQVALNKEAIDRATAELNKIDAQLLRLEGLTGNEAETETARLLKVRSRVEKQLSEATQTAPWISRLRTHVVPWFPEDRFDILAILWGVVLVATIFKGVFLFIQDALIGAVVELSAMGIRKEGFRRVLALDYQTLRLEGTSDLMSRFTYDMNVLSDGLALLGGKVIREPLKALACIVLAFLLCWQLTLLSLLFVPLAGLIFYRIGKQLKRASQRMMESMSRIYKTLEETFDSAKVVIAFGGARRHRRQFHHENKQYFSKAMKIVRIDALTSPTTEVIGLFAAFIALLPGAYLVLRETTSIWGITLSDHPMDIARLTMLYVLLAGTIDPARKLSSVYSKLKKSGAAADRIFELLDRAPLVKETSQPVPLPRHQRSIEFDRVSFTYATKGTELTRRPAALDDVNLSVSAGEMIVVVGGNGSGKSTLVNLLPRFFDPNHGSIRIDGVDVQQVRLRDLRGQIGVVTQETLLFDGTIHENILYGRPGATREEVERAAARAFVTQFVEQLPEGFRTNVGTKGQKLSGGQRQRVALARAMLRDPAILILDEATSAIDAQSEALIHGALREFVRGRTTFLITHSVSQSILDFVSRIVVMDQGRIVEVGTHEHLLRNCLLYRDLFQSHTGRQFPDNGDPRSSPPQAPAAPRPSQQPLAKQRPPVPHLPTAEFGPPRADRVPGDPANTDVAANETDGDADSPRIIPLRTPNPPATRKSGN
ncbi:MAG: ABC transporter transmembrane domain-containing protein [Planctomycetaceae bacterium]